MTSGISATELDDLAARDLCADHDLQQISGIVSDAVSELGVGFEQVLEQSKIQEVLLLSLLVQVDGEDSSPGTFAQFVTQSEKLVAQVTAKLEHASQRTMQLADKLAAIHDTLRRLDAIAQKTSTVSEQIRVLSFNAKLEASRAGKAGGGFSAVASAVAELSGEFAILAGEIRNGLDVARTSVVEVTDCAKVAVASDSQTVATAREQACRLQADTSALNHELRVSLHKVKDSGRVIQNGANRCIRALQFDDLVRQICLIARQRVDACRSVLSSGSCSSEPPGTGENPCDISKLRMRILAAVPPRSIQQTTVDAGDVELF